MQRKKLKKTNEFNKNNLWTRMLLCFLVSLTLIGLGALLAPTAVAQPPSPRGFVGYVYECGTTIPIDGVLVTGTNLVTSAVITATTGGGVGVYILEFDVSNNPDGSTVHITYEGTGQWTGWFAEQDVVTDYTIPHPQPVPDVYLCWYYKPAGDTSPSGMPDFGPQGTFSDAAAAVANCLWWFDNNRPEYDNLVPIEDPLVLMSDLDMYLMGDLSAVNVQAAIDAYLAFYLGTPTDILYTTLYPLPDFFDDIAEELEISQDVLIQLYIEQTNETLWVTGAGVNAANMTLAISDPYMDNAEAGGPGRVPVAHPAHPSGDPTHNDPSLVSHDFYAVGPGITAPWALIDYFGYYADIINVITVCPFIVEEIQINKTVWDPAYGWGEYVEIYYGETATFNISVCNTGNSPIEDVNIYDMIPAGLEYVPGSATIIPTYESPNYLEWAYSWTLDAGECIYIEFDVIATSCCSDLINEALVTAFGPVGYIDFYLIDTAMVHPLPITNMEVTKEIWDPDAGIWTDFAEIRLGENAMFRISIYNDPATNPCCSIDVLVDDYVGYGGPLLEYAPGTVTVNGVPMTPDIEFLDEFIFLQGSLTPIPPGGTMEIIFEATAVAEGNFTNAVYVEYNCTCGQESAGGYAYAYADGFIYFDVTPPTVTKTLIGPVCDENGPITNPVVGRDWTLLATYNLPGSSPETWHNDIIDLSAYDGHQIQLAFRYLSDDEWAAYFDDILVWDGSTTAHFEDFDAYADGYDFDGTAACGFYTQENYGTACGSTYHYAEVENYKSHSSPNSAEIYYNCPNDDWLITPEIDLTGLSGAELDFWYLWDDSWDILFEVLVNDLGGGGQTIEDYWITSDTQICFDATDDNSGAESLTIDIYYDMNNDGVINYTITDELQDQLFITDNVGGVGDPRDTNPAEGEITYCMTLPEECFHVILYYATDYEGNYPMNETTQEPIPAIEVDLVDNTPPIVEKTFSGPGTLDYLFLNEETIITLNATDLPEPPETEETFRGDTFYAYCAYGTYSYYTTWFDSDTPGILNPIAYDGYTYSFMAGGTWIDDTWWGSEYGGYGATYNRIWTIDETTGDMTLVGNTGLGTTTLNGIAYDDSTGTLYGCSSYGLYTVDMTTGVATHVGDWGAGGPDGVNDIMIDMACDGNGNLYGIECGYSYDNGLYSINPSTGAASLIGYTGLDLFYAQGAEYDKDNDILYLAAYTYYAGERGQPDELAPEIDPVRTGWFYICDTNTGATTLVGSFQGGSEMTALAIPYTGGGGGGGGGTGEIISPGCASGIVLVEYRVWYDGVWGNWTTYWNTSDGGTGPFSLEEGCTHYLQYRAVDCLGNTLLCEDDIETPPYERGHIADVKMDPSDGIPIPASDIGSEEGSVAPQDRADAWLRYDQDTNNNALGLTAGGTMEWAIRLTPTELAGYDGWEFNTVQFHYGMTGSSISPADVLITVYGPGTASAPGSVITTELVYATSIDWYDVPLTTPIVIDETQDIWISCTCTHPAGEYPAGMNSAISGIPGKSTWLNLGGWADYYSYNWVFNIAAGLDDTGAPPPPPPPPEPVNITVYNQTHYLDLEPPMSWIELELDHDGNMITPYTEFMIWQEDFACNQTYGSQCCFIHFRIDGPPGSMFYWNGQYIAADGSWHTGDEGFDTPIAFQIRDSSGYIKAGKYVVEYYAEDCLGNVESTIHHHTYYPDTTAPTTTLLFSGPYYEDQDEWINYATEIKLDTGDLGSGEKLTKYRIDNDAWQTYTEPFHITAEGTHIISYYSKDWTNNIEDVKTKTVIVDSTAPQANLIFDGDTYDDETTTWITSDTNIQLPATDTGCGLKAIYYRVDSGEWTDYTDSFTLTTGTLIEFYTEDHLGNTAPIQQFSVGLDNEAPSITYIAPQENHLYIAGREILALRTESIIVGSLRVEATATDACGVEKIEFYIDGTLRYMEPGDSLQWLWDEKSLFVHTLTIKAYDNLGRVATKETKVNIFNF